MPRIGVGFFRNEGTRSTPCDPKQIFWCVRTIWVHSGLFGCLTKLDAKRSELVQNFVPRTRIRIFRNERTRSTPFYPKLIFWCISYRLGAFVTVRLPYETRCKTGRTSAKFVPRSRIGIFHNEHTRTTPLDPKLMFSCVCTIWVHSGQFGCLTKLGAKRAERVQKFVPRSCVGIFHNESTRSTPFNPKLMFWCIVHII